MSINDEGLSRLIPTSKIGNDGFPWWIGQVEGVADLEENNKGGYRYKVAIVGEHPKSRELISTAELPWANVMMPVNQPFAPGNIVGSAAQLTPGCWVVGFYIDNDKQKPIIMGSIGQTPGSTTLTETIRQEDPESRFATGDRTSPFEVDPLTDGNPGASSTSKQNGGPSTGTRRGDGELRVDTGVLVDSIEREEWCQLTAEKCDEVDTKTQMKNILAQFLADIQSSNGNIGDYYVSKYTGGIYRSAGTARQYVNKAVSVIQELLARIKGYIVSLLQKAVDKLVKAVLRPNEDGNALTGVTEFFNKRLKDLGCKMEDIGLRLAEWLTNVLMSYVNQIYRAAICQVDELVNGIISKIYQLMNELLESILGPLQDILGAIAAPLNLIGNAINYILRLLGITCTGPDKTCAQYKKICTDGSKEDGEDDENFLDKLLSKIDNLFGDTPGDYTQYVCEEAYDGAPLEITGIGFTGGVPLPGTDTTREPKIVYSINDVTVTEGEPAVFTITRSGITNIASSVSFKTLTKGTATSGTDYLAVDDIIGFSVGESEKTIQVQTLVDTVTDGNEIFYVKLTNNSPEDGKTEIKFTKNIGQCTILEKDIKNPYDPYNPIDVNPFEDIEDNTDENFPTVDDPVNTNPTFNVVPNRSTCPEDEFIIYTITTTNIPNGAILYYNLTGEGITPSDIVGNKLNGEFVIQDNEAKVTVGIREDSTVEDEERLTFSITGTNAFAHVLITTDDDLSDFDSGIGDDPSTVYQQFRLPVVDPNNVITDDTGGIIEIPVDNPGDAWAEPPNVFVTGAGIGATASALLDDNGFLTEIRIQSSGFGYKKNLASDNDVRCIIDTFTVLSPGLGYESAPDMYINGELGVAEAIVQNGFVIGARVLNRTLTFDEFPRIELVGGGGYGARLLPSLACLNTDALTSVGATKIGTGRYVDCP
tara:strand:+ start:1931 stop:4723 length:2793 start_codon:yes stop_codon:yes gene_type:complete